MDSLLDTAPCGFLSFRDDGIIQEVNATLCDWLGTGSEPLLGQHLSSILPLAGQIYYQTHFFPLLKLCGEAEEIYLPLRPANGTDIPVLVNAVCREREGMVSNDCILLPIRRRSEYEDELLRTKKAIEQQARQIEVAKETLEEANAQLKSQIQIVKDQAAELERQKLELVTANARLAALATTDGLTDLKNRRAFQDKLAEEFERTQRYLIPFSLVLLDVDNFKSFNDTYGHLEGDRVLKTVAQILKETARETDTVCRYGGEEFVIVLADTGVEGAMSTVERLLAALEAYPWDLRPVTASFGVSTLHPDLTTAQQLVDAADRALYASKRAGRNQSTHAVTLPELDPAREVRAAQRKSPRRR